MEEHLDIVQTLCRTALATGTPAVRYQVERLRDALKESNPRAASALSRLLTEAAKNVEMRPSRLVRAAETLGGEHLLESTSLPVDRETSTPLVEIIQPADLPLEPPVLQPNLNRAITSLLEEWANAKRLRQGGLQPVTTALIYGPPGAGKTHLAKWIAAQLDLPVVVARLDGLISSFLGTTSRNIGSLFAFAQRYRCMLLLDEFDALAKMRDDPQEVGEIKRVVNTLLQNLDARREIGPTIAITNHEGLLDPAIWRRFDAQIALPRPDLEQRRAIVARYAPPLDLSAAHQQFLAWLTDQTSGAEIETLLRSVKRVFFLSDKRRFRFMDAVREYAHLNTARLSAPRIRALMQTDDDLANILRHDVSIDVSDLAEIFSVHRTTITRWLHQDAISTEVAHAQ